MGSSSADLPLAIATTFSILTVIFCGYIVIVLVKHSHKAFYHLWNKLAAILFFCTMIINVFRTGLLIRDIVTDHAAISDTLCYATFGFNEFFSAAVEVFYIIFILTLSVPRFYEPPLREQIEWKMVPCVFGAFLWACLATAVPLFTNVPLKHARAWCWMDESNSAERFAFVYVASAVSVLVAGGFVLWVVEQNTRVPRWRILTFGVTQFLVVLVYAIFTFTNAAYPIPDGSVAFRILGVWLGVHDLIRAIAFIVAEKLYPINEFFPEGLLSCCCCSSFSSSSENHPPLLGTGRKRKTRRISPRDALAVDARKNEDEDTVENNKNSSELRCSRSTTATSTKGAEGDENQEQEQEAQNNRDKDENKAVPSAADQGTANHNDNKNNNKLFTATNRPHVISYTNNHHAGDIDTLAEENDDDDTSNILTKESDTLTYFIRVLQGHSAAGLHHQHHQQNGGHHSGTASRYNDNDDDDDASDYYHNNYGTTANRNNNKNRNRNNRRGFNNDDDGNNSDIYSGGGGASSDGNDSVYAGGRGASFMHAANSNNYNNGDDYRSRFGSSASAPGGGGVVDNSNNNNNNNNQYLSQFNSQVGRKASPLQNSTVGY